MSHDSVQGNKNNFEDTFTVDNFVDFLTTIWCIVLIILNKKIAQ